MAGTSRCSSGKSSAIAFCAGQPHQLEVLKAASNALVVLNSISLMDSLCGRKFPAKFILPVLLWVRSVKEFRMGPRV